MSKQEIIYNMIEKNNGYLFSAEAENEGISRTYIAEYVKKNNMERVAKGIYISEETWVDELFVLQRTYSDIIFSGETALYLHNLLDREYDDIYVNVPGGFSGSRLRKRGVIIHQERPETYGMGLVELTTVYGNTVRVYDRERCICELVRKRANIEVQDFQTGLKSYMRSKEKDLAKLIQYSEIMKIRDEVMKYVEVLV